MVVKLYISGISGNKEVKKRQQRVMMILDSKNIKYDVIDITEPGREADKDFMQSNSKSNGGTVSDPNPRSPLPPQLFNDEEYCGDYDQFDLANEVDTLEQFLKMEVPPEETPEAENEKQNTPNGDVNETNGEAKEDKEIVESPEAVDDSVDKTESLVKEDSPVKEPSSESESKASKEGTPVKDESTAGEAKEKTPEIESDERQKSVEKEGTPKAVSPEKDVNKTCNEVKESSSEKEAVNENGTVSSREQSQDKDTSVNEIESKKDNPSDALIQSEQAAAE